jgi:uncharacterized protein (TIGR02285 family)
MRRLLAVLPMAVALVAAPALAEDDRIVWAALDFPPFAILQGEHRGGGSFDGLLQLLVQEMPEYRHEIVPMTFARREGEIRAGQRLCTPGLFRTPAREGLLVFSQPALIHLDNRVVALASRADKLGPADQAVDLEALFKRADLVGGIIAERSFAPNIDPLIKRFSGSRNLVLRPMKSCQMFEMLLDGEIDYTLLFPHEAAYLAGRFKVVEPLQIRSIAGTPPYIATHVACTKGAWGEAVIRRIDGILARRRTAPEYRALSERWYGDADKALIRRYYPKLLADAP